jgi:hypothetical protein
VFDAVRLVPSFIESEVVEVSAAVRETLAPFAIESDVVDVSENVRETPRTRVSANDCTLATARVSAATSAGVSEVVCVFAAPRLYVSVTAVASDVVCAFAPVRVNEPPLRAAASDVVCVLESVEYSAFVIASDTVDVFARAVETACVRPTESEVVIESANVREIPRTSASTVVCEFAAARVSTCWKFIASAVV